MQFERLIDQLKKDEGFSPVSFWDNDQWTWGYGTKAPGPEHRIKPDEAELLLRNRARLAESDFAAVFHDLQVDDVRKEALINMLFNLGITKFGKFKKLRGAVIRKDWGGAAFEAFNSRWYQQVGKRAKRIVWELLTGEKDGASV